MDIANMLLAASRNQALNAIQNHASDLSIGTMSGTGAVVLEDGYSISGDMLEFTQFCYDQVIDLPYTEAPLASHTHSINKSLTDMMGISPVGPVTFVPAGTPDIPLPPYDEDTWKKIQALGGETLALNHDHSEEPALPQIRLWRGVKNGDRVLVLKVNTRHFIVLCRIGRVTNEEATEGKGYAPCNA